MRDRRPALRDLGGAAAPDLWPEIVARAARLAQDDVATPHPARRAAVGWSWLTLGAAGVALILAVGGVFVAGTLRSGPTAAAILEDARLRFGSAGAFDARIELTLDEAVLRSERPDYAGGDAVIERRLRWAAPDLWRLDTAAEAGPGVIDGGAGSFRVRNGAQQGMYRADSDVFVVEPSTGADPLAELGWDHVSAAGCAGGSVLGQEQVAGVATTRIACPDREVWVDREAGLIMRHTADGFRSRIVAIDPGASFEPAVFRVEAPPGRGLGSPEPDLSSLVVGEAAPAWVGEGLDGEPVALEDLRGSPAAIYLWAEWCDRSCLDDLPVLAGMGADAGAKTRLLTVAIQSSADGIAAILRDAGAGSLPVVIDDGSVDRAWAIEAVPQLVVLDPNGMVAEIAVGHDIDRLLEDLGNGAADG